MIYFIRIGGQGPIKIGQTINLTYRLSTYRPKFGDDIEVLGVMRGGRKMEKRVLKQFDHLRDAKSVVSEWRRPEPDLLEFIRVNAEPWDGSDDLPKSRMRLIFQYMSEERTTDANREWLSELSHFALLGTPTLIDQALMAYAKSIGFLKPKPTRHVRRRKAV